MKPGAMADGLAASALVKEASAPGAYFERRMLTLDQLDALLAFWRPWLGLSDWSFRLEVERKDVLGGNQGQAQWNLGQRYAIVRLMAPVDDTSSGSQYDMEQTLVHELLHVGFAGWTDEARPSGTLEKLVLEQPIDRLASTLVRLARLSPAHPLWVRSNPKRARRKRA